MMKLFVLGIALGLTPMAGSAQNDPPQPESPKQVVERFCKMEAEGMSLGPEHWDEFSRMTTRPHSWQDPWQDHGGFIITVVRDYVVNDAEENGNHARFKVDYSVWGSLFTTSFRFFREEATAPGEPVKRSEPVELVFSDKYIQVGQSGQMEAKGPLQWRVGDNPHRYVNVDAAIRYLTKMRDELNDPVLKYNADRTLAALRSILAGTPALLQRTSAPPESPSQVFQRFYKLETAGKGLTPDGWHELADFFVETPKLKWQKIHIVDVVDVGEALIEGDTAEIGVRANSLGDLDSSLRLSGSPSCKPSPVSACYGDTGGFGYTFLLSEKPWDGTGKESTGPLAWRIYEFDPEKPEEPQITLDTAIRFVTQMRDKTNDPVVKKNADKTLATLAKLH
jgi:hypothetical protein